MPAVRETPPKTERSTGESLIIALAAILIVLPVAFLGAKNGSIVLYKLGLLRTAATADASFADIDAFIIAARMLDAGRIACLYALDCLGQVQGSYSGMPAEQIRMTWNYPPTMDVVILPMAWLDPRLTYALVLLVNATVLGLMARALCLSTPVPGATDPLAQRMLAWLPGILFLTAPSVMTGTAIGQTGPLTAAIAWAGLARIGHRPFQAGCILGLLVVKPHLAILLPFVALAQRDARHRIGLVAGAATTVLVLSLASLVLFGAEVWTIFLTALGETRALFIGGGYARSLVTSVYVSLIAAGVAEPVALAIQAGVGVGVGLCLVDLARRDDLDRTQRIALTLMALPLASPYIYYYDFVGWTAGLTLLAGRAIARGAMPATLGYVGLSLLPWAGMVMSLLIKGVNEPSWPFQPMGFVFLAIFLGLSLPRHRRPETVARPALA